MEYMTSRLIARAKPGATVAMAMPLGFTLQSIVEAHISLTWVQDSASTRRSQGDAWIQKLSQWMMHLLRRRRQLSAVCRQAAAACRTE